MRGKFAEVQGENQIGWGGEGKAIQFPQGIGGTVQGEDAVGRIQVKLTHYEGEPNEEVAQSGVFAFLPESLIIHDMSVETSDVESVPSEVTEVLPEATNEVKVAEGTGGEATEVQGQVSVPVEKKGESPVPVKAADRSNIPKQFQATVSGIESYKMLKIHLDLSVLDAVRLHYSKQSYEEVDLCTDGETGILVMRKAVA